jgi:hypothetical protein
MNQTNETQQPEIKIASELHAQLGIEQPFKEWIAGQPGFSDFEPFFGRLPGGALGKDYKLSQEHCDSILKPIVNKTTDTKAVQKNTPKKPNLQPIPGVELADRYYSIETYT